MSISTDNLIKNWVVQNTKNKNKNETKNIPLWAAQSFCNG